MQKLTTSLIVFILCAIIGIGWGVDQLFDQYAGDSDKGMIESYKKLGKQLADSLNSIKEHEDFIQQWNLNNSNQIAVTHKQNFPLPQELESQFISGQALVLETEDKLSLHYFLPSKQLVLSFTPDEFVFNSHPNFLSLILTSVFYIGILLFILIWLYPLIKRLNLLRTSAKEFGSGELSKRIDVSPISYIGDIETEFNRMAQKIEALVSDNKLISSAVSHDLRTPLSRLRFGIDILSETNDPKERDKYQQHLSRDIDEMQSLVEVLLNYARLEQSMVKIDKQVVNLSALVKSCVNYFEPETATIQFISDNDVFVNGDEQYLSMLFNNLLKNAVEYSKGKILVEVLADNQRCLINIHDDGCGIVVEQRELVRKPFVRGDVDVNKNNAGYGMGLAISERITDWHKGEMNILQSDKLHGALLQIIFSVVKCEM